MIFENLPTDTFDVLVLDPPWKYYGDPNKMAAAGKHYDCLTTESIGQLPVQSLLSPRGLVFVWTTSMFMQDALTLLTTHWDLAYRGVAFVWVKTTQAGKVIMGQGVRPSITKPTTEFVIVGSRLRVGRPLPLSDESIGQVILAPRAAHSEKPTELYDRLDLMYPTNTKLDLFARKQRLGWEVWGNEVDE